MDIDVAKLADIEARLTNGDLTDADLAAALHAAGLPEVARVLGNALQRGTR